MLFDDAVPAWNAFAVLNARRPPWGIQIEAISAYCDEFGPPRSAPVDRQNLVELVLVLDEDRMRRQHELERAKRDAEGRRRAAERSKRRRR